LGIEKSAIEAENTKEAEERAKSAIANRGSFLDLSQISSDGPSTEQDGKPSMFYDPESEMTPEDIVEADPTGQLPLPEQVNIELAGATWPTFPAAVKEVFLLIAVVIFTGGLIIGWDNVLREFYTNTLGIIPTKEEIMSGSENMVLPEGWTNGMSEDDFMNFQDEVGTTAKGAAKATKSVINSAFPEL
jgi:preprotein translocase subunit SecE